MWTHCDTDGVGPSKMKSWYQPGGQTPLFGGATIVHVFPTHENSGNSVLAPIALPCVLDGAATSDMRSVEVVPWKSWTLVMAYMPL